MASEAAVQPERHSRFWLFAPFAMLALLALAWSAAWFFIRNRATEALDGWFAAQAATGRQWTCPQRSVGGYPFRIEIMCRTLAVQQPDLTLSLGRVHAVAQVYQPRHVIIEAEGPLRLSSGPVTVEGQWNSLRSSLRVVAEGFQTASLVVTEPVLNFRGPNLGTDLRAQHFEAHLRPDPARGSSERALDVVARASGLSAPVLDNLIGGSEPAHVEMQAIATQARDARLRSVPEELERWRQAGGKLELPFAAVSKGNRRLEARGELTLDALHRPTGRLDLAARGLDGLLENVAGGAGGVLGALLAPSEPPTPRPAPRDSALKPLPPLRIDNGRVAFGLFPLPGFRVSPLY